MFAQKIVIKISFSAFFWHPKFYFFPRPIDDFRLPKGNLTLEPYTDKGLAKYVQNT